MMEGVTMTQHDEFEADTATGDPSSLDADSAANAGSSEGGFFRWIVETALLILLAFALAQGIKAFVVQPFVIPTGSMKPTIMEDDRVLAEKLTFRFFREPSAGDIVVFDDPVGEHPQLIKRIIAVAGQTIDVRDDAVYVDDVLLDEAYTYGKPTVAGSVELPARVPEGQVWLMGDNRPNSGDSRFFGPRPVETVRGRAFWTYWPPSRFGDLR